VRNLERGGYSLKQDGPQESIQIKLNWTVEEKCKKKKKEEVEQIMRAIQ
jgi:hypothetical protein